MVANAKNQFSNQRLLTINILTEVLNTKNRMQSHIRNLVTPALHVRAHRLSFAI